MPFVLLNNIPRFRDQLTRYKNRSEAIFEIRNTIGNSIPTPKEGTWENPTRDCAMKRIFFSSIGCNFVKKLPGFEEGFVADLSDLDKYALRTKKQNYASYGCKTYFDYLGNIVKIVEANGDVHEPGSEHWEWAKLKSRTSVFIKAAFRHFGELHYMWVSDISILLQEHCAKYTYILLINFYTLAFLQIATCKFKGESCVRFATFIFVT